MTPVVGDTVESPILATDGPLRSPPEMPNKLTSLSSQIRCSARYATGCPWPP